MPGLGSCYFGGLYCTGLTSCLGAGFTLFPGRGGLCCSLGRFFSSSLSFLIICSGIGASFWTFLISIILIFLSTNFLLWIMVCENSFNLTESERKFLILFTIIGILRMVAVLGLLEGSTYKSEEIRFLISLEKTEGIEEYCPFAIFMANNGREGASKGGLLAQSSYKTTPKDQISDLKL